MFAMRTVRRYVTGVAFVCLLAFSCIQFYVQQNPPSMRLFYVVYQYLRGTEGLAWNEQPFPHNVPLAFSYSTKIDTGQNGPTIYARDPVVTFGDASTEYSLTFYAASGQSLPPLVTMAPAPSLHVGGSVFALRNVSTKDSPGREMTYLFSFPAIGNIEDYSIELYLKPDAWAVTLWNPNSKVPEEQPGTNVWGILVFTSVVALIVLASTSSRPTDRVSEIRRAWKEIDSERLSAQQSIGIYEDEGLRLERHKLAQQCIADAERILLTHYEDVLSQEIVARWLALGALFLCVVGAIAVIFAYSGELSAWVGFHSSSSAYEIGATLVRVERLEKEKLLAIEVMLATLPVALLGIAANIFLSRWRTKSAARRLIQKRLAGFADLFDTELMTETNRFDELLKDKLGAIAGTRQELDQSYREFQAIREGYLKKIEDSIEGELQELRVALDGKP